MKVRRQFLHLARARASGLLLGVGADLPSRRALDRRTAAARPISGTSVGGCRSGSAAVRVENRPGGGTNVGTEAVVALPRMATRSWWSLQEREQRDALRETQFQLHRDIAPMAASFARACCGASVGSSRDGWGLHPTPSDRQLNVSPDRDRSTCMASVKMMTGINMVHVPIGVAGRLTDLWADRYRLFRPTVASRARRRQAAASP